MVQELNQQMQTIFSLNVSGVTEGFTISSATLCSRPNSKLAALFSGQNKLNLINDKVFIDRDPTIFRHLINFLRTDQRPILENKNEAQLFECELKYWGVENLEASQQKNKLKDQSGIDQRNEIEMELGDPELISD